MRQFSHLLQIMVMRFTGTYPPYRSNAWTLEPWLEDFGCAFSVLLHRHALTSCSTSRETTFSFSAVDDALIPFSQYTLITIGIIVIVTTFMTFFTPHNYLFYYFDVAKWF